MAVRGVGWILFLLAVPVFTTVGAEVVPQDDVPPDLHAPGILEDGWHVPWGFPEPGSSLKPLQSFRDIDNDGVIDWLGVDGVRLAAVRGAAPEVLWMIHHPGATNATLVDLDADGVEDVLLATSDGVSVYDGRTGRLEWSSGLQMPWTYELARPSEIRSQAVPLATDGGPRAAVLVTARYAPPASALFPDPELMAHLLQEERHQTAVVAAVQEIFRSYLVVVGSGEQALMPLAQPFQTAGWPAVGGSGDRDGDGIEDLLLAGPAMTFAGTAYGAPPRVTDVRLEVRSTATGARLAHAFQTGAEGVFEYMVVGQFTPDGRPDAALHVRQGVDRTMKVYDGTTLDLEWISYARGAWQDATTTDHVLFDADGDGALDVVYDLEGPGSNGVQRSTYLGGYGARFDATRLFGYASIPNRASEMDLCAVYAENGDQAGLTRIYRVQPTSGADGTLVGARFLTADRWLGNLLTAPGLYASGECADMTEHGIMVDPRTCNECWETVLSYDQRSGELEKIFWFDPAIVGAKARMGPDLTGDGVRDYVAWPRSEVDVEQRSDDREPVLDVLAGPFLYDGETGDLIR